LRAPGLQSAAATASKHHHRSTTDCNFLHHALWQHQAAYFLHLAGVATRDLRRVYLEIYGGCTEPVTHPCHLDMRAFFVPTACRALGISNYGPISVLTQGLEPRSPPYDRQRNTTFHPWTGMFAPELRLMPCFGMYYLHEKRDGVHTKRLTGALELVVFCVGGWEGFD